ncbi:unnamed protein product [Ambrosiozyma monospora]|uniref:Unnamed protein product n=1 Tax=Ambrosiozyma monospora TaxID=43982 RepID=A0A9W6T920_AMBMO|nr:unnamed protein product [Ambrosiozyma monospora]
MSEIEQLSKSFSQLQSNLSDLVVTRRQLETQFQENKIVKDEFNKLDDESKIYKLVGPVLLPQDSNEANMNVDKRIEFIKGEIDRVEAKIAGIQKDMEKTRTELIQATTQRSA